MSYNEKLPRDDEYIAAGPADIRENFRALKEDQIVDAGKLAGLVSGNAGGNIPVSNGTVNAGLNADKLDGLDAAAFAAAGHAHATVTTSTAGFMGAGDKTKLDGIAAGAQVNQNAFGNVAIGSTTIQADSATDTLSLTAGANITLTPDATNDAVTIAVSGTVPAATTAAACSGNAATATKWATARALNFSGDATGSMTVDGSTSATANLALASTGVIAGTYSSVTVDEKGRVLAGANPSKLAIDITGNAATATLANTATWANTAEACQGNAATASKLANAVTIAGVAFDGGANISIPYDNIIGTPSTTLHGKQIFTESGTFTVPEGVTQVLVTCVGGAGGGGGNWGSNAGGSGGTGYKRKALISVVPEQTVYVTIGAGGAGGGWDYASSIAAPSGGGSSFGSYLTASGGAGGTSGYVVQNNNAMARVNGTSGGTEGCGRYGEFSTFCSVGGAGSSNSSGAYGSAGTSGMVLVEW